MTHFVNSAARTVLEAKTVAELRELQTKVEISGRKAKEAMKTVDGNRVVSQAVRHGRFVNVSAAESSYNSCRMYWKDIETIILEKEAA